MKIAIGADHRGFAHKETIKQYGHGKAPDGANIQWLDVGAFTAERSDYPVFVHAVCAAIKNGEAEAGILLCGSGVGMSIAANRIPGMYAALVWNVAVAQASKQDDNANILVIPADFVSAQLSIEMIQAWLRAEFKGGRYADRLRMID